MLAFVEHRYPALWPWIQLMRLDRPIGSMLLMWPTLWALWIAGGGTPSLKHIVIFVLGVFVMRAAGCVINDFADRDFDGHVTRTRGRPLATGALSARQALMLFAAPLAGRMALPAMAALLVITAWNMAEPDKWRRYLSAPVRDRLLIFLTMALTVLVDLTVAIGVGVALGFALSRVAAGRAPRDWTPRDR